MSVNKNAEEYKGKSKYSLDIRDKKDKRDVDVIYIVCL